MSLVVNVIQEELCGTSAVGNSVKVLTHIFFPVGSIYKLQLCQGNLIG